MKMKYERRISVGAKPKKWRALKKFCSDPGSLQKNIRES